MNLKPLGKASLPKVLGFRRLLGPSFILLGLGLGSGELIMWPYLSSQWGMGLIWGAILGITFQYFLNMEIERYTLINGESIFVGLARKFKIASPIWFIIATLIPWMWPGIILSSALLISYLFSGSYQVIGIILLLLVGAILTLGPVVYKTQEHFQKALIFIGVPFLFVLTFLITKSHDWSAVFSGLIGRGDGFWFFPKDIPLISFLAAFAYAGAGGTLNLAQSFYIKEKGYGMGKYGGKITSILTGKKSEISLEGKTFTLNPQNLRRFRGWWRSIGLEHALVFWLTGAITIIMLSVLSYATVYGQSDSQGIYFLIQEAQAIGAATLPFVGFLFLLLASTMLFSTQLSVMDATSRIMSENIVIANQKKFPIKNLPKYYYLFLWLLITLGIIIILLDFKEPLQLVTLGAALNAVSMFVYSIAVLWLNLSEKRAILRPSNFRVLILLFEIAFFGLFSLLTLRQILI